MSDALTGGTGDVKPQYMTLSGNASAAGDDFTVTTFALPILRPGVRKEDLATVIEILRVDWYYGFPEEGDFAVFLGCYLTTNPVRSTGDTASLAAFQDDMVDGSTLAAQAHSVSKDVTTAVGETVFWRDWPKTIDTTDGMGNGILVATNDISIVAMALGDGNTNRCIAKVLYRFVNVTVMEYVGIVQAQQG